MIVREKLNVILISFVLLFVASSGFGVSDDEDGDDFDVVSVSDYISGNDDIIDKNMMRWITALRIARYVKPGDTRLKPEHLEHWKTSESDPEPVVSPLVFNKKIAEEFLGPNLGSDDGEGLCGVFIAQGPDIIIAFSGKALRNSTTWKGKNEETMEFGDGLVHRGAVRLWKAVEDDLLGGGHGVNEKENKFLQHIKTVYDGLPEGADHLSLEDTKITILGYSVGGMVAQMGALKVLDELFQKKNSAGHVIVITLGSPLIFDEKGAKKWDKEMGGTDKHLRVTAEKDTFWRRCSGKKFNGSTGIETILGQRGFDGGLGWFTGGRVYHSTLNYQHAAEGQPIGIYGFMMRLWQSLPSLWSTRKKEDDPQQIEGSSVVGTSSARFRGEEREGEED